MHGEEQGARWKQQKGGGIKGMHPFCILEISSITHSSSYSLLLCGLSSPKLAGLDQTHGLSRDVPISTHKNSPNTKGHVEHSSTSLKLH